MDSFSDALLKIATIGFFKLATAFEAGIGFEIVSQLLGCLSDTEPCY
jgi:hypothetical protein